MLLREASDQGIGWRKLVYEQSLMLSFFIQVSGFLLLPVFDLVRSLFPFTFAFLKKGIFSNKLYFL
jgi:hypothetical protein